MARDGLSGLFLTVSIGEFLSTHPFKEYRGRNDGFAARAGRPNGRRLLSRVDGGSGHSGKRAADIHLGLGNVEATALLNVDVRWRVRRRRVEALLAGDPAPGDPAHDPRCPSAGAYRHGRGATDSAETRRGGRGAGNSGGQGSLGAPGYAGENRAKLVSVQVTVHVGPPATGGDDRSRARARNAATRRFFRCLSVMQKCPPTAPPTLANWAWFRVALRTETKGERASGPIQFGLVTSPPA
jgi:ASPIC and UnbV